MTGGADPKVDISRSSDPGLEVDHLFVGRAFNAFQARVQAKTLATFTAAHQGGGRACITLAGANGVWTSPVTGAFGGAALSEPRLAAAVPALVETLTTWLRSEAQARAATFRLPPDCFPDATAAALENALFRAGWRLDQVDLDQYLPVTSSDAFVAGLGETKQKERRRLLRSGAVFRSKSLDQARPAYDAIEANRAARGYPMTMSWPQLHALAEAFPDRVGFHAVERDEATLAGAVVLQVTPVYAYVFYWGEDPACRREAPLVLLAEGLMRLCHERGASILDIGISTEASQPNLGLVAFKTGLGCRTAGKRTYRLDLGATPAAPD